MDLADDSEDWSNHTDNVNITDHNFIGSHGTRILAAVMTVLIICLGIFGNAVTLAALVKCPKLRNATTAFIVSLCVADLSFVVLAMPFSVHRFINGVGQDEAESAWCVVQPFAQYANVGVSLLSIAMITINRFIRIAYPQSYARIYTRATVMAMVAFIWLFSFAILIPILCRKWGEFGYEAHLKSCSIIAKDGRSPKRGLFVLGFLIPCITITICYANIFWVVRRSEMRMRSHSAPATTGAAGTDCGQGVRPLTESEWRVTKMVLAIFLSFLVCYLPITITKTVDKDIRFPNAHLLSYVLIYMSACMNPIIYVIMNSQYRQAYRSVLCSKWSDRRYVNSTANSHADKSITHKTVVSNVSLSLVTRPKSSPRFCSAAAAAAAAAAATPNRTPV